MASHHAALCHGLTRLGAIAPSYQADILLLPDLERFVPELVLTQGHLIATWKDARIYAAAAGAASSFWRRGVSFSAG